MALLNCVAVSRPFTYKFSRGWRNLVGEFVGPYRVVVESQCSFRVRTLRVFGFPPARLIRAYGERHFVFGHV
jgi:hypothetical protein